MEFAVYLPITTHNTHKKEKWIYWPMYVMRYDKGEPVCALLHVTHVFSVCYESRWSVCLCVIFLLYRHCVRACKWSACIASILYICKCKYKCISPVYFRSRSPYVCTVCTLINVERNAVH